MNSSRQNRLGGSLKYGTITIPDATAAKLSTLLAAQTGWAAEEIFAAGLFPADDFTYGGASDAADVLTVTAASVDGNAGWEGPPAEFWPDQTWVVSDGGVSCDFWAVKR